MLRSSNIARKSNIEAGAFQVFLGILLIPQGAVLILKGALLQFPVTKSEKSWSQQVVHPRYTSLRLSKLLKRLEFVFGVGSSAPSPDPMCALGSCRSFRSEGATCKRVCTIHHAGDGPRMPGDGPLMLGDRP